VPHGGCTKIGVLGGIGPEATAEFYTKLITSLQKQGLVNRNADFPQIIINSIPAPELIHEKISKSELLPYVAGLKMLDSLKPDFIVMVCNTVYSFYDALQMTVKSPILDVRKHVKEKMQREGYGSAAILATKGTIESGLYEFEGINYVNLTALEKGRLEKAIFNFNRGHEKERQKLIAKKIAARCIESGADVLILGCTELALMLEQKSLPCINTIDTMVEATISALLDSELR
jgi:aspartate racemase